MKRLMTFLFLSTFCLLTSSNFGVIVADDAANAGAVVLPATLDVTNVSFRSENMPDFVLEDGDYAGTYFDMGPNSSSNDTLLYAEWDVTIQPLKYNVAVDVYNTNSWSVRLHILNQSNEEVKTLYYKGHSGEIGQFAIGTIDMRDLVPGDYKVRVHASTAWSAMKLKDVILEANYSGATVELPETLLPAYAELSEGASVTDGAIAFKASTADSEYATWNVSFAMAGNYNVTIDFTTDNGHTYGVALLSADGQTQIGSVVETQSWNFGDIVEELGTIAVPAAGNYIVKLTNSMTWSNAVLNSITFTAIVPAHTYTIAGGSTDIFGASWNPSHTANDMEWQVGDTYKWEKSGVSLPVSTVEFKVCEDHDWTVCYPVQNYQLSITAAGVYTITITFDPELGNSGIAATAVIEEETVVLPTVRLAGTFTGWSGEDMTIAENHETYSITKTLEAGDYSFKVIVAGNWLGDAQAFTRANTTAVVDYNDANMTLVADVDGDYTFTWTYETSTLAITFPAAVVADEWDKIIFTEAVAADNLAEDATFAIPGSEFALTIHDSGNKMVIDANDSRFGTADDYTIYNFRIKSGGASRSDNNYFTLNIPEAGTLRIAPRTASNAATDRALVIIQGEDTLYNAIVQESQAIEVQEGDTTVNVYPYVDVKVAAGTVSVRYTAGMNFYAFAFKADGETPEPVNPNQPQTSAPTPTHPAAQVMALYSDSYTPTATWDYNANWSQTTTMQEYAIDGDHYLSYSNFNYQGWHTGQPYNVYAMQYVHLDLWAKNDCSVKFYPIYGGTGLETDDTKSKTLTLTGGQWNSYDIPLTDFDGLDLSSIFQIKFDTGTMTEFCVDNVYFYRNTSGGDNEAPTNVAASLKSVSYFLAVITVSAEDNSGFVRYTVKNGNDTIARADCASGRELDITLRNLLPATSYTFTVIASDDNANNAQPQTVQATTGTLPESPAVDLTDKQVVGLFCDSIEVGSQFNVANWSQTTQSQIVQTASGNHVYFCSNFNYLGWDITPAVDVTDMAYLHVDLFSNDMTSVNVTPISPSHEGTFFVTLNQGSWTSADIPLSSYDINNLDRSNVYQFKFDHATPEGGELIIDNIYFYRSMSGTCGANGDNLTWQLSADSVLTISGTGAMANYDTYSPYRAPWYSLRNMIKTVVIGEGVTTIGYAAFYNCSALACIRSAAVSAPTVASAYYSFYGVNKSISVYIPQGSRDRYRIANGWSQFSNIRPESCSNFDGTHSYSIVGGFTNNWSLSDAIAFVDVDGVLTANVSEIEGMFKVIRDKDTDEWTYQWGRDLNSNTMTVGTPYTMSNTSRSGGEPGNLSFSNPFIGYRNAVLTLTEDAYCDLVITLVSGEPYYTTNDWYLAGAVNEWTIGDDYKFAPLNGSDTMVLDVTNMTGGFKIVYGNWKVEFGANVQYDSWTNGTEYVMTYPCAEGLNAASSRIYDQATLTLLPDYANATVKLWVECKKNLSISAQHGSVNNAGGLLPIGTQLQLTVTPEDGYSFSYWSDFSTENPRTITVSESLSSLTAVCVPIDSVVYLLCLAQEGERSVYFIKPDSWQGDNVHCYMWDEGLSQQMTNDWPGNKATAFTERLYKFLIPDEFGATTDTWYIIWNNGSSSQQTEDHLYVNNAVYSIESDVTYGHGNITTINYVCTNVCDVVNTEVYDTLCAGRKYYVDNEVKWVPDDYEIRRTYISPSGGDSIVMYHLHVMDCGEQPIEFELQFKSTGTSTDTGTPYELDVNSMFTSSTVANANAVVAVNRAYPARVENGVEFGAKLGAGSGGGSMKFVLTTPVVADSILFRVAKYGSDDITYFLFNNTQVGLPTSKNTFETFRLDSVGWIDTITIASVDAGYKRFFIQGLTIYGKTPSKIRTEQAIICEGESVTFYGKRYTQDGQYSHSFNVDGTDSVVILRLNVIPTLRVTTDVDTINSMQQYSWHGRTWRYPTWTGVRSFYDTLTSAVTGCDSINELQLYVVRQSKPKLTLTLERDTVTESESTTLTIRSEFALPADETINLSVYSGSSYIQSFPSSVLLPAGETEVSVTVQTKDNDVISNIRTATLRASGDRFYNTISIDLRIIDNDTPEISLSLSESEVQEGSCARCITATVLRLTHPEQDITIRFSDNSGGRISYPSSSLRMNANVTELTATLGVNDNSYCDGTKVIDIVARVNNAYLPCAYDTAQLTILDNDVPTLTLRSSSTMLLEGKSEAGVLTVSRNTPTDTALVVNLSVDNADGLTFPATLTIPAGQSQAQTTVAVARNGVNDDSHQIVFTAASEGFTSSDCYVMVIDQTLPDAIISSFNASPTTAEVGSTVNVQITVRNQGAAGLAKGITTNLYFNGSRVAQFALESTLPMEESITFNTDITLPEKVGTYTLYATVNEDKQVKEILHTNNRSDTWYIHTTPSFEVLSLTASKTVCMPGDSVILTGQLSGSRAANAEVEIYSVNNGYRLPFKVMSDNNGAFTAVFKPQSGQNGHFAIGACYPSERSTTEMVGIDYYGFEVPVGNLTCNVNTGYDYENSITVRNTGSLALHNIHAEAIDVPEGCQISFTDISELRGGSYGHLNFTLRSDSSTQDNYWQTVSVQLTTDEGLQAEKIVYYFSRDPRGRLISSVSSITASVSIQRPMEYKFLLQSTGLGETGAITLSLPDWMQSVTPQTLPSIASGEYAEVVLRINTSSFSDKLNLPINGSIGISAENSSGMSLPFTITPVSDTKGTLHVDVCDENTYYAEGFPHVAGAQVLVKNTSTRAVIAQGTTNASGVYEIDLPEGYYTVSVTADNHDSYTNNILLQPEETTSLLVNLSIKAITVTWTVEETEVEDTYEIVTTVNYETHVPQPVVVVSAPSRIEGGELEEGQSLIYNVTATNQGLIRAEDVTITLPDGGGAFSFEALAYSSPFNMEAKQSVVIPVKVTRLAQAESAPARAPHGIIECQGNMLTLYYWDCGTDRKWHQYATPLLYMDCDNPPTIPTPSPDVDEDVVTLPTITVPTISLPWPPSTGGSTCSGCGGGWYNTPNEPGTYTDDRGCEPCQNQFLLNVGKLGLDLASLAADVFPQTRVLALAKHVKDFLGAASDAVDCYNNARQAYAERHTIEAALLGCVTDGGNTSWEEMLDELQEELSNLDDAIRERMENHDDDDDQDDNSDDIFDDAMDVIDDLLAFTRPCEHTAENAAYAPMRTNGDDEDLYAGEPEHLARFKSRIRVALEEIEALENYKKLYISADVQQYCSNAEIEDLMNAWQTMISSSLTDDELNSVRPAALPDEQWLELVERMHNTHDAVRGIQPANDNYVSTDSINYYTDKITACESKAKALGYTSSSQMFGKELNLLLGQVETKSNSVCASISLQFKQTMTLTRQAFRGTLSVFNGHETQAMTNIHLDLDVRCVDNGQVATSHEFQISLEDLSDISGEQELVTTDGWTIAANTTGTATILFIPTVYAAPQTDRVWSFGGTLTYTDPFTGLTVTRDLYPVQLTVKPTPMLEMTYFMQRDVYADDPLTDEIEESEPAEFALLINNIGYGEAKNVNMTTNAPEIVDNEKGLLIDFNMLRSLLNGKQASLPIGGVTTTQFGTIPAQSQAYAQWYFESTLLGHFRSYDISATHVTSYNNPDLSLIDTVTIHEMIHSIGVPAVGSSQVGWLVNDDGDINDLPETLYTSDGIVQNLYIAQQTNVSKQDECTYTLTLTPSQTGWNYGWCVDPTRGLQTLLSITRLSDNAAIDLRNVWQTPCVMRDLADPVHEHRLNIADSVSVATTYRLVFSEPLNIVVSDTKDASTLSMSARTELTVTPTGHLTVDQPATVHSLTLQYSEQGHAQVTGITDLTAATVEMSLQLPTPEGGVAGHWFAFGVPFEVNIATGIRIEGADEPAHYGFDYIIDEYDGAQRAATQDGWKRVQASANLQPGRLYMLYSAGETAWRFTATHPAALTEAQNINVQAYASTLDDLHSGWNGIANTRWSNAEAALDGVGYATAYNNLFSVYQAVRTDEYAFVAAQPFFVQAVANDELTFAAPGAAPAPWRTVAEVPAAFTIMLTNSAQTFTDKAYLSVAEDKQDRYLIGHDLEKMQAAAPAVPQLWIEAYGMHLAAHELPFDGSERVIPIGLYAPTAADYMLALSNTPAELSVILTKEAQPVWNIAESACILTLEQGDNAGYALILRRAPQIATGVDGSETTQAVGVQKVLMDDKLFILRDGKLFFVTGVRVQ